jgi:peptidyl-prolyl cis-trans isomerase SurA
MRKLSLTLLAGSAICLTSFAASEVRNGIAAIVNDSIITYQQVEDHVSVALEALRRTPLKDANVFAQRRIETLTSGLEDLVTKELILADFKSGGFPVPDTLIEDEIRERVRKRFGDRVTLTKTLQAQGMTQETFRKRVAEDLILQYMRQKNVSQAVLISPKKIENYYTNNVPKFQMDDQVKLRAIVLNSPTPGNADEVRKLAQEIGAKLDEGATFSEMAAIYSEGSQRSEGGDWGWRERNYLWKGLSDVVFALDKGQRSGLIGRAKESDESYWIYIYDKTGRRMIAKKYNSKDELGEIKPVEGEEINTMPGPQEFYLMLVEDKRLAHVRPLEEVRDEIEKELIVQERARLHKKWVERLRSKAFVRYF